MKPARPALPDWDRIDTVLLDLDGTLLDLHYDNHFWQEVVPAAWARARGIPLEEARAVLKRRFEAIEGTLDWYSVVHWSEQLGLDLPTLKQQDTERLRWLPGARDFLVRARAAGKRLVLITNSHPVALSIKDAQTGVLQLFDAGYSSHQFHAPKELPEFWERLLVEEPYDRERSLFVDDNLNVLRAARRAGIAQIWAVRRPDSSRPARVHEEFSSVDGVAELI
ncbi:MAG TPA: HAD-IA family hydrolase [Steroidobacteraceae bacterium]|nr:HAD-IA family hydrolase [Steroidobacteraceae bacterium]